MSATNRGTDRVAFDNYPTPSWCTRRILERLREPLAVWRQNKEDGLPLLWREPCCGDGAIVKAISSTFSDYVDAGDIRTDASVVGAKGMDFREWTSRGDVTMTNPPFELAPSLIDHFLPRTDWLVLLLRSSFRLTPWRDNMPDEYRLPERPSFVHSDKCTGCLWARKVGIGTPKPKLCPSCGWLVTRTSTDAADCSWFVWTPERGRRRGVLEILPSTPQEERCRV